MSFYWTSKLQKGQQITKNGLFTTLRSQKKTKKQNIKNLTDQKFLNVTRNMYTKNWTNMTNIEEEDSNLLRKKFAESAKKNVVFRPKIGTFFTKFAKILQINTKHLNTSYVEIVGHLGHFWVLLGHFWSFFVIFWPLLAYIIILGKGWLSLISLSRLRSKLLNRSTNFQNVGHFGKRRSRVIR